MPLFISPELEDELEDEELELLDEELELELEEELLLDEELELELDEELLLLEEELLDEELDSPAGAPHAVRVIVSALAHISFASGV